MPDPAPAAVALNIVPIAFCAAPIAVKSVTAVVVVSVPNDTIVYDWPITNAPAATVAPLTPPKVVPPNVIGLPTLMLVLVLSVMVLPAVVLVITPVVPGSVGYSKSSLRVLTPPNDVVVWLLGCDKLAIGICVTLPAPPENDTIGAEL